MRTVGLMSFLRAALAIVISLSVTIIAGSFFSPVRSFAEPVTPRFQVVSGHIYLANQPTALTGFNSFQLAGLPGHNRGCGASLSSAQLAHFFSELPSHSVVRFNAYQSGFALNQTTDTLDFSGIDRVVAAATLAKVYLIPVIGDRWGGCDDGLYKSYPWFDRGYKTVTPAQYASHVASPAPIMSYRAWVDALTKHYGSLPTIAMYEPLGEASATTCPKAHRASTTCDGLASCPNESAAASALKSFYNDIGSIIHKNAPGVPVEAGLLGGAQCGTAGASGIDYKKVGSSPGIDVLSVHVYNSPTQPTGFKDGVITTDLAQAQSLGKPLINGETGMFAGSSCTSTATRAQTLLTERRSEFARGVEGFLVWNYAPSSTHTCDYDVVESDPLLAAPSP